MPKREYRDEEHALGELQQAQIDPTAKTITPVGSGLSLREGGIFDYLRSKHGWRLRPGAIQSTRA